MNVPPSNGPLAQLAEAADSKPAQSGFKSLRGYLLTSLGYHITDSQGLVPISIVG